MDGDVREYNYRGEVQRMGDELEEIKTVLKYHTHDISKFSGHTKSMMKG
jgi:hypothetical protein